MPRVNASLRFDNQPFNLRDKKGADDLLSSLLGTGSQTVSKEQFNKRIDFLGANVNLPKEDLVSIVLSKIFLTKYYQLTADQSPFIPEF